MIQALCDRDFLTGNPGWQGSNTFVSLPLLRAAGCFREGLQSLNDRDLALRLLRQPQAKPAVTNRWTATWYSDTCGSLSEYGSPGKLHGLRQFWRLYRDDFTHEETKLYFERASRLFGFGYSDVAVELADREFAMDNFDKC